MRNRQNFLSIIALSMIAALVGCGSSSKSGGGGTTTPTIAISATSGGSQTATTGTAFAAPLVATVTSNGSPLSGATVTFTAPASGASGTFSGGAATETDTTNSSGVATSSTFTANTTAGSYTVTAAVSGATSAASFGLTNSAPAGPPLADGTYVFQLSGTYGLGAGNPASAPSPYFVAGAFVISGGAITGGEQDFVDINNVDHDMINATGSAVTATTDGNVQIVLTTCTGTSCTAPDPNVGVAGVETLNASMASASSGRVIEFDTAATASGTIDAQNTTAAQTAPSGGYIFGVQGLSAATNPLSIAGILNVSGATISTTGTVFDLENNYAPFADQTISAGTLSGPDSFGRVVFGFTPTDVSFDTINLAGYIVDASHVRIAETNDTFFATLGGTAFAQNATAGSLAVSGNSYVVGLTGSDPVNGVLQAASLLSLGSTGNVTGTISYNDLSVLQPAGSITAGTYVADTTNLGRVTLTGVTDGTNTFDIQLYVDGNGNAISMTLDTNQDGLEGVGFQQTASSTFSGAYVLSATGADFNNEDELDAVGSITTGTGTFASTTGTGVDLNWISAGTSAVPTTDLAVSGAFTAPSGGVSTGAGNTITGLDVTTSTNADAFTYYVVDATDVIAIEADTNQLTLIYFVQ